jgi:putative transposase
MTKAIEIRKGRHCVFLMHAHLVFVTKYRKAAFAKAHLTSMQSIFNKICDDFESKLVEFDGEKDHVHLLINYPPKISVSRLVNSLKGVSSRKLRLEHPDLLQHYWKGVLWSPSYFAGSCGGAPIEVIRKYIERQNTPV